MLLLLLSLHRCKHSPFLLRDLTGTSSFLRERKEKKKRRRREKKRRRRRGKKKIILNRKGENKIHKILTRVGSYCTYQEAGNLTDEVRKLIDDILET